MYDRGRAVRAYWAAAEKRAWVHTLEQEAARLQAQAPQLSAMREKPGGPEAGLRWNSQRRTVEAELDDANREYQAAQFTLAELLGQPASETGPLPSPSDAPYAGTYDFKSDSPSEDKRQSPTVTRHAEAITRWAPVMRERAESVVAADAAFADAAKAAELDPADMETLLDSLVRQRRESRAFLRDVRHYAGLIADYSLAVLPRGAQSSRLATALGVGGPASGP